MTVFWSLTLVLQLLGFLLPLLFFGVWAVRAVQNLPVWMTKRALAALRAGRPDRAVLWARRALACRPPAAILPEAYTVAGLGLAEQGALAEADYCLQQSIAAATVIRRPDIAARAQATLASLLARQGFLEEALEAARQAAASNEADRRPALMTQARVLRAQGKWPEARRVCQEMRMGQTSAGPSSRRAQAASLLALAWTDAGEAEAIGDRAAASRAWEALEDAGTAAEGDDKTHLWCEATAAWVEALRGDLDEARRIIPLVKVQLPRFRHSRHTLTITHAALARTALLIGDLDLCCTHWAQFFAQEPDLPDQTGGHYFLGDCLWRQGHIPEAKSAWRQAVALNVDTYYARRAFSRLAEADGTIPTEPFFDRRGPQSTVWPPPPKPPLA